jgi:hypothetical protein
MTVRLAQQRQKRKNMVNTIRARLGELEEQVGGQGALGRHDVVEGLGCRQWRDKIGAAVHREEGS